IDARDRWLGPLRLLGFLLLGFLFGSRDFLLQLRYQVVLATHLLTQEFSLSFQTLDLLGVGQRLCYRRAESQATGAGEGPPQQALWGKQGPPPTMRIDCCNGSLFEFRGIIVPSQSILEG